MKRYILSFIICVLTFTSGFAQNAKHAFRVYGFIPYAGYFQNGQPKAASFNVMQQYLATLGISKYNLIYESRIANFPDGNKTHGVIDTPRLQGFAKLASLEPEVLVALDLEGWNRFDTVNTTRKLIDAVNTFKAINKQSPVGFYATVPQDTYGNPKDTVLCNKLNKAYANVAAVVDYFSPSLYNYRGAGRDEWKKEVLYNVAACKKYGYPQKKIIPYITPEITINGHTELLNYDEMLYRLNTLYELGVDGCLLWTSSGTRDADGKRPFVNEDEGWLKAVKDFIRQHKS
ncbi:hypothetical protein [Mucilaginibacter sp. L196]|jgi:hypothetical protein|uniref:hypothetical protein n=1 Tax=Mucilaginibacter sp. L196 TaxID=1641870 RepID=UPI00131B5622|nr:hypothetical protein [Mucilaginibacter sp. L196]